MSDHETRSKTLERARKEFEDSFLVMTLLETKQSNVIKQQAQATEELQKQAEEQRRLNRETDKRIAKLVSAVGRTHRQNAGAKLDRIIGMLAMPR